MNSIRPVGISLDVASCRGPFDPDLLALCLVLALWTLLEQLPVQPMVTRRNSVISRYRTAIG